MSHSCCAITLGGKLDTLSCDDSAHDTICGTSGFTALSHSLALYRWSPPSSSENASLPRGSCRAPLMSPISSVNTLALVVSSSGLSNGTCSSRRHIKQEKAVRRSMRDHLLPSSHANSAVIASMLTPLLVLLVLLSSRGLKNLSHSSAAGNKHPCAVQKADACAERGSAKHAVA